MEFEEILLDDLVEAYIDNRGKTCPIVDEKDSYLPLIATNCITEDLYPQFIKVRHVDKDTYNNWFRAHPKPNDIIFVNKGTPGGTALVPKVVNFCFAQDMVGLRIKEEYSTEYIFAVLRSNLVKRRIEAMQVGTMIPHFKKGDFKKLYLPVPIDKKTQEKIGEVHLDLLKKIDLNKQIISNLERLAQTLFKRWFVDYEFPDEFGNPYKSSGGEMVESELGMIPKNWEVSEIGKIAKQNGKSVSIEELKEHVPYIGLEHMPRGSIGLGQWESSEKVTSNKTRFNKGDILFGKLRPYFKKVGIAPNEGVCSTDILVLNTKKDTFYSYFTCLISQDVFIKYCTATATGTRMPRTGWKQISKYGIALPPEIVAEKFDKILRPFFEKVIELIFETKSLSSMRDTLLPKLLSGEIEIPDETEVTENVPVS